MNTFPAAAATEIACKINSVTTADTMRSPLTPENEVGSPQVSSDTSSPTIANQYHSNGSEANNSSSNYIDSPSTTVAVSNRLVSDRKQQLEQKTITIGGGGKCAKNNRVLSSSLSSLSTSPSSSSNSPDTTATLNKPASVLQKYLQSQQKEENNKRTSLPNWFPSKRNSLILLADQNLDQLQKNSPKMVAPMQEQLQPQTANTTATFDVDSSEELQYGPGIEKC